MSTSESYNHKKLEKLSQKFWQDNATFNVDENSSKQKFYCLSMLPYPSGNLHKARKKLYDWRYN